MVITIKNESEEEVDRLLSKMRKSKVQILGANRQPFYLEIQKEGKEEKLKRVYENQLWAFEIMVNRYRKDLKDTWKDEFCLYWSDYLKGKVKNINDYLGIKEIKEKENINN